MIQEQDIVERLLDWEPFVRDAESCQVRDWMREAAQTIAALRAERDEWKRRSDEMDRELTGVRHSYFEEKKRAEAAKARVKELEIERNTYQELHKCAISERDEARQRAASFKARIDDLWEDNSALSAGQCIVKNGLLGDEGGSPYCSVLLQRETAIRERDEWKASSKKWMDAAIEQQKRAQRSEAASSNREGGEE